MTSMENSAGINSAQVKLFRFFLSLEQFLYILTPVYTTCLDPDVNLCQWTCIAPGILAHVCEL